MGRAVLDQKEALHVGKNCKTFLTSKLEKLLTRKTYIPLGPFTHDAEIDRT